MNIIGITPARPADVSARGFKTLCFFDAQVSPDIRMYGLELVETPDGKRLIYAPSKGGRRVATMSIELGDALAGLLARAGVGNDSHVANAA
jgi:hypothetical protein